MNERIREWYMAAYPTDDLGSAIREDVRFGDLFDALDAYQDVYALLGDGIDSVIRERCFQKLSEIMGVDYDYVYNQWLRR